MQFSDLTAILHDYDKRRSEQAKHKQVRLAIGNLVFSEHNLIKELRKLCKKQKPGAELSQQDLFYLCQLLCEDDSQGKSKLLTHTKGEIVKQFTTACTSVAPSASSQKYFDNFYQSIKTLYIHDQLNVDTFSALCNAASTSLVGAWSLMTKGFAALKYLNLLSKKNIINLCNCDSVEYAQDFILYLELSTIKMPQYVFDRLIKMDKARLSILVKMMENIALYHDKYTCLSNQAIFTLLIRVEKQGFAYDAKRYEKLYSLLYYLTENPAIDQQKINWLMNTKIGGKDFTIHQLDAIRPLYRLLRVLHDSNVKSYRKDVKKFMADILENIEIWTQICGQEAEMLAQVNNGKKLQATQCYLIWQGLPELAEKMKHQKSKQETLDIKKKEPSTQYKSSGSNSLVNDISLGFVHTDNSNSNRLLTCLDVECDSDDDYSDRSYN